MADSIDEGKRENLTFDGTSSSDIRYFNSMPINNATVSPKTEDVPRYKLCIGSMINIRIALKYGN